MNLKFVIAKVLYKLLPPAIKNSYIDKTSKVLSRCDIQGCSIGRYTYVGYNCKITNARIGSFCSIADCIHIGGASHPMEWVSTSPVFCKGKNILGVNLANHDYIDNKTTEIGNDVWIGSGANIKAGLSIGTGAVIGSESMVVCDVRPYEIWAGNPAKFIRKRFDDEMIEQLLDSEWWDLDEKELVCRGKYIKNPSSFLK